MRGRTHRKAFFARSVTGQTVPLATRSRSAEIHARQPSKVRARFSGENAGHNAAWVCSADQAANGDEIPP